MKMIGWSIILFNYLLTVRGWNIEVVAGMLLGVSIVTLGYYLEKR